MRYVLLVLLGLFILVILIAALALWTRTTIILLYRDKKIKVTVKLLGLHFSREMDTGQAEENGIHKTEEVETNAVEDFKDQIKSDFQTLKDDDTVVDLEALKSVAKKYYDHFKTGKSVVLQFLGRLRYRFSISKIELNLTYGLGDPAQTGMAYGAIWGAAGILYPLLREYFRIVFPVLNVTPDFQTKKFELEAESIIRVRAAHIINAAIATVFTNYQELKKFIPKRKSVKAKE